MATHPLPPASTSSQLADIVGLLVDDPGKEVEELSLALALGAAHFAAGGVAVTVIFAVVPVPSSQSHGGDIQ